MICIWPGNTALPRASLGYVLVDTPSATSALLNIGASRSDYSYESPGGGSLPVITAEAFVEAAVGRRWTAGALRLFASVAADYAAAFKRYDTPRLSFRERLEAYSFDRSVRNLIVRLPLLVAWRAGSRLELFASWRPSFSWSRSEFEPLWGVYYDDRTVFRTLLSVGGVGMVLQPTPNVRFTFFPQFTGDVVFARAEVHVCK